MLAAMSRLRPSRRDPATGSQRRSRAGFPALSLAFLFAVGASFGGAYGASAEDGVGTTGTTTEATTTVDTPTVTESPTVDTPTVTASPTPEPAPAHEPGGGSGPGPSPDPEPPTPDPPGSPSGSSVEPPTSGSAAGGSSAAGNGVSASVASVLAPASNVAEGYATTWLHGVLPDPTPPARRLAPAYARLLQQTARRAKVDWALLHAVVRARGHDGRMPSSPAALHRLAGELRRLGARADAERAVVRLGGAEFGQRVLALRNYNRAVGLKALVTGLERAKPSLERRLLRDRRVQIYTVRPRRPRLRPNRRQGDGPHPVPGCLVPPGHGLEPAERTPPVRATGGRLRSHLRPRSRRLGAGWAAHRRQSRPRLRYRSGRRAHPPSAR